MAISSFIFGGQTGETPETLARKRAVAQALAVKASGAPKNVGEGLSAIGNALLYRSLMGKVDAGDAAGRTSADNDFAPLMGGFGSSADTPAVPGAMGSAMPKVTAGGDVPVTTAPDDIKALIAQNVPPEMQGYATNLIGKESSFNPNAVSPTGAKGLAQFTKGTGRQYGLVSDQGDLRADPAANLKALVALTNDNRNSLTQALGRAPTDGELALAHQQGAQGAIALLSGQKVPGQNLAVNGVDPNADPRDAAKKIMSYYGGSGGTQVASLDPGAGMPQVGDYTPYAPKTEDQRAEARAKIAPIMAQVGDNTPMADTIPPLPTAAPQQAPYVDPQVTTAYAAPAPQSGGQAAIAAQMPQGASPVAQALAGPQAAQQQLPPLPVGNVPVDPSANPPPVQMAQNAPSAVAQALAGGDASGVGIGGAAPKAGEYFPAAPSPVGQSGPSPQQILRVLTNPYATPEQKAVASEFLKRQQDASDPEKQLGMRLKQAQIDALSKKAENGTPETFYGNPVAFTDASGNTQYGQIGSKGSFKPIDIGQGNSFAPNVKTVDTGTEIQVVGPGGTVLTSIPKNNQTEAEQKATGTAIGKSTGDAQAAYDSMASKLPGLETVVTKLDDLSDKATYTTAGQLVDWGRKEVGLSPRDAAIARTDYISTVDNQVLPLLRETFGAAFTEKEGNTLRQTLGDPDKSPQEKKVVLHSFIEQKKRDLAALATQAGGGGAPAVTAPATAAPVASTGNPDLDAARDAISKGAPREAVIKRLQDAGIDTMGL